MPTARRHPAPAPVPARRTAMCMCARGATCSSFAEGHAVHLIQARLVSSTPTGWVDAVVVERGGEGTVIVRTLDDGSIVELWNGAGAAAAVTIGDPVAFHRRYHALSVGGRLFNVSSLR